MICTSEATLVETGDEIEEYLRQAAYSQVQQQYPEFFRARRTGEKQLSLPGDTAIVEGSVRALAELQYSSSHFLQCTKVKAQTYRERRGTGRIRKTVYNATVCARLSEFVI